MSRVVLLILSFMYFQMATKYGSHGDAGVAMDQDTARQLFDQGAALVFLGVPRGTEFGIDYNTWNVDTNFKGVKMIPPGIHFVYYRLLQIYI